MKSCIAITSRSCTGSACRRPGVVCISLGRYVCALHHMHGWIPADLDTTDPQQAAQRERAARVMGR